MPRFKLPVLAVPALALLVSSSALAQTTFAVTQSVVIDSAQDEVFCFAADPINDAAWRSEVNEMTADGPWAVGTTYYEDSTLGLNPSYLTVTYMAALEFPTRMVVQSPADSLFLRAERTFAGLADGTTRFTYHLEVDTRMPQDATGLLVPTWLVRWHYTNVMRRYQQTLKRLLEAAPRGYCAR
jgi:hypothetical protein